MNIFPTIKKRKTTGEPVVVTQHRNKLKLIKCETLEEAGQIIKKEIVKYNKRKKHRALTDLGLTRCTVNGRTFYE